MLRITSKNDLKRVLKIEIDSISKYSLLRLVFLPPYNYQFIKALRTFEYHLNSKGIYHRIMAFISYLKYRKLTVLTGLNIPVNTCDEGLTLYHTGSITVNSKTKIGKHCCIMNNVNIGANGGSSKAPIIGDNVYIGPGAVIYGDIFIADGCYIGANAVVNKSFEVPNSVIVGVPAKSIGIDEVNWWKKNSLNRK